MGLWLPLHHPLCVPKTQVILLPNLQCGEGVSENGKQEKKEREEIQNETTRKEKKEKEREKRKRREQENTSPVTVVKPTQTRL